MYENYTKAIAVLNVLEKVERKIASNQPFKLVSTLRREGLYLEKSIAYLTKVRKIVTFLTICNVEFSRSVGRVFAMNCVAAVAPVNDPV